MSYRIVLSKVAKQNIENSILYYKKNVSDKVALNFINEYKKTFDSIQTNPFYKVYSHNFRGKPMRKFPYIVFYTLNENQKVIIIKAVFHTSQNPTKYPRK